VREALEEGGVMDESPGTEPRRLWHSPVAVLAGALLFNLGQGVLRPTMPLYLQQVFSANYRMVTLIPVAFGIGKWVASLPTGYLLDRLGRRRLMTGGLILIALGDLGSAMTSVYGVFLILRAMGGVGWAAFSTVATTTMVDQSARRGRAVSLLLMSETLGLLFGSTAGGWLYQGVSVVSPFVFEAACMLVAVAAFAIEPRNASTVSPRSAPAFAWLDWRLLRAVLHIPGVLLMSLSNAVLIAIQTGVLVFLFPLYLVEQGGLRPEMVGLVVSLSVLGRLLGLWLAGNASDRWGRVRVFVPAARDPPRRAGILEPGDRRGRRQRGGASDRSHRGSGRSTTAGSRGRMAAHGDGYGPRPRPYCHGHTRGRGAAHHALPLRGHTSRGGRMAVPSAGYRTLTVNLIPTDAIAPTRSLPRTEAAR